MCRCVYRWNMSEIKKAPLINLGSGESKQKPKDVSPTARLFVELAPSNEDSYPELNYKEELELTKVSYHRKWSPNRAKSE